MNPCVWLQSIQTPGQSSARSRLAVILFLIASSFLVPVHAQVAAPQCHDPPARCRASFLEEWAAGCFPLSVWIS
jgi:hypothetical protein